MHPEDAAARGLVDGQHVRVSNTTGTIDMVVELATNLPRGVALAAKSRWPKLIAGGLSVNALNPGTKSDMAESSSVHGIEVEITHSLNRHARARPGHPLASDVTSGSPGQARG